MLRQELEAKKAAEAKLWGGMKNEEFSGQNAETIIRDRRGRKLEMLNEFMNQVRGRTEVAAVCRRSS